MSQFLSIVLALCGACFDALDNISYKRVSELAYQYQVSRYFQGFIDAIVLAVIMLPIGLWYSHEQVLRDFLAITGSFTTLVCIFFIAVGRFLVVFYWSKAYANEKISVLAPYTQTSAILSILAGFFLFPGTTSVITLVAALTWVLLILASSIHGRKIEFSKHCGELMIAECAQTLQFILAAYLLLKFDPVSVLWSQIVVFTLLTSVMAVFLVRHLRLPTTKKHLFQFFGCDIISNLMWSANALMALFLFRELGITLTVLLSMITLAVTLVLSYFIFGDRPTKHDILLSFGILIIITIGVSFSHWIGG